MSSPVSGNENFTNVENLVGQVRVLDVVNLNAETLLSQTVRGHVRVLYLLLNSYNLVFL